MKKIVIFTLSFLSLSIYSQEHFSGISTTSRAGILNGNLNPAELVNLSHHFEANIFSSSFNFSNNKIGFKDIISGSNLEDKLFIGTDPVNLRVNAEILGPSFAMKIQKWGLAFTTKAMAKLDVVDIDTKFGDAIFNSGINSFLSSTTINNNYNQRFSGTTWGEVGLAAARTLYDNKTHKFSAGINIKLLFPGSYANLGLDKFTGTITNSAGTAYLNNTNANLNVAYSGGLANSFTNFNDYSKSVFGNLNGFATDLGVNYQWKDGDKKYKINAGIAIKNIGTMTFNNSNNFSTNYNLNIQPTLANPNGLDLNQFANINNLKDVETVLISNGYLNTTPQKTTFKVKLPTTFTAYADLKIVPKLYATLLVQQKLNNNNDNDQITAQNIISLTPRVNLGFFEAYTSWSNSDVSGVNGGIGFRLGGFFIGSSSAVTALINDSKQVDIYTGFRWAFL